MRCSTIWIVRIVLYATQGQDIIIVSVKGDQTYYCHQKNTFHQFYIPIIIIIIIIIIIGFFMSSCVVMSINFLQIAYQLLSFHKTSFCSIVLFSLSFLQVYHWSIIFVHNVPCDIVFKIPSSFWKLGHFAWSIAKQSQLITLQIVWVYTCYNAYMFFFLTFWNDHLRSINQCFRMFFQQVLVMNVLGKTPILLALWSKYMRHKRVFS